jgi:hypothetical protein
MAVKSKMNLQSRSEPELVYYKGFLAETQVDSLKNSAIRVGR